jgi:hypothetical protein
VKRARSIGWTPVLLAGALHFAPDARAAGSSRLVYGRTKGAESCPGEADLRAAVRARLGYDPFFPWAEQTVVVHITARPNRRMSGKVYLVDAQGGASPEREFTTSEAECQELVYTLALAIVMTLDPLFGTAATTPTRAGAATPPKESANDPAPSAPSGPVAPVASAGSSDAPSAERDASLPPVAPTASQLLPSRAEGIAAERAPYSANRPALQLGAAPFVASGVTPGFSTGFIPSLRGRFGEVSVSIEGRLEIPLWSSFDSDRADVSHLGGAIVPCWHWTRLTACPTLLVGEFGAEGREATPRRAAAFFAALGARTGAEFPIGPTSWAFLRAEVLVNLTRHQLVLAGEPIWKVPAVGFALSAGALTSIL